MIRAATPADLPALRALQSLLPETAPKLLVTAIDGPGIVSVSVDGTTVGGDGLPVGYVLVTTSPETAHVAEIVVAPDHRREGRARRLLAAALARLRKTDATRVELAVEPDNNAARRLYGSLGFEDVRREEEYYGDEPAVLMARPP